MKQYSFVKLPAAVAICIALTACSNSPKKIETPQLGAAVAAPTATTPEIVTTPRGPSLTLNNVLFDFEESSLRTEAQATVAKAVTYLRDNPDRVALVEGHTDNTGDETYNHGLSVQRSESVREALVSNGISNSRIKTVGLGESSPIADNSDLSGRQTNRRVEIIFKPVN
ncbi:UNVERIFIED_CONTAM: hypothetical protein GTU68_043456 [Idotea baltica]|nr:hypothetical protein [Idotea baltica]